MSLFEDMTLPIRHGCDLHIIRKYPNTDDETFCCRFVDANDKPILIKHPDWLEDSEGYDEVRVWDSWSLSEVIRLCYQTLKQNYTKDGNASLNDNCPSNREHLFHTD